jgi:hypothetical protein
LANLEGNSKQAGVDCDAGHSRGSGVLLTPPLPAAEMCRQHREKSRAGSPAMIRTAIISVTASVVLFGAWTINLVSYHPANDLNPLAPLSAPVDWK